MLGGGCSYVLLVFMKVIKVLIYEDSNLINRFFD